MNESFQFQNARFRQVRLLRGIRTVELAEALEVQPSVITRIEKGEREPSPDLLARSAQIMDVDYGYFYKKEAIQFISTLSFRRRQTAPKASMEAAEAGAVLVAEIFFALSRHVDYPEPAFPREFHSYHPDLLKDRSILDSAARRLREFWGIDNNGPINDILILLENHGFPVVRNHFAPKLDAFSFWAASGKSQYGFIALDYGRTTTVSWRYTSLHELGHLLFHSRVSKDQLKDRSFYKELENQADYFAGAFLMPEETFGVELRRLGRHPQIAELLKLKLRWRVSIQAIIERGRQFGLYDETERGRLYKRISDNGYRYNDPADLQIPEEKSYLIPDALQMLVERGESDILKEFLSEMPSAADVASVANFDLERLPSKSQTSGRDKVVNLGAFLRSSPSQ